MEGLGEASLSQGARECFFRGSTATTKAGRLWRERLATRGRKALGRTVIGQKNGRKEGSREANQLPVCPCCTTYLENH